MPFLILQTHFLLKVISRFCQGHVIDSGISIRILVDMATESIVPSFFDAHLTAVTVLYSLCETLLTV